MSKNKNDALRSFEKIKMRANVIIRKNKIMPNSDSEK